MPQATNLARRRSSARDQELGEYIGIQDEKNSGKKKKVSGVLSPVNSLRKKLSIKKTKKQKEEDILKK